MGKVVAQAIMSLDGYVAKQDNSIGRLFDWLQSGEVEIPTPAGDFAIHLTPPSSEHLQRWVSSLGALVCGRTLFDVAEGWHGRHTLDVPVVVVTHRVPTDWVDAHPEAPFTFVTDGVAAAVAHAQKLAGDRVVAVTGGTIARQCLDLGLLDEVAVDLVPVVMGQGNRPFFGELSTGEVLLGNPSVCVQGDRVTHLVFPVIGRPVTRSHARQPSLSDDRSASVADHQTLRVLEGRYVLERAAPDVEVGRDGEVLALVRGPDGGARMRRHDAADDAWVALWNGDEAHPPDATGMLAAIVAPLAAGNVPVWVAASFDGDIVLIPVDQVDEASELLRRAGHRVIG